MRTANIPNVLFPQKTAKTVTASTQPLPISPFSGRPMIEATVNGSSVLVDQQCRIVVPRKA